MSEQIILPDAVYTDDRGRIISLPSFAVAGATVIESFAGAVRGNHYHLNESHLMYVVSGLMIYIEEGLDKHLAVTEVGPGQSVVSPPGVSHCTVFAEDTVFLALSDWDRKGDNYENEVVRVSPMEVRPEVAEHLTGIDRLILPPAHLRKTT
ncbi:cupin domain-containing protein [Lentzea sp.]|uniref:cupin domain-containing protein n=1 Tax=Lentzea sp. TaxID=56099 RepID=UPI002C6032F5|nr:cupin domain-containing protein [Lentzea sp.]HUQ55154.1 cupin domain-containing protein [Lentzea sp.]